MGFNSGFKGLIVFLILSAVRYTEKHMEFYKLDLFVFSSDKLERNLWILLLTAGISKQKARSESIVQQ